MPHPDDMAASRLGHRLNTPSKSLHRIPSSRIPERFQDGDDAQEDVSAPPRNVNGRDVHYMNQSIFSMIAAAGSRSDFHARFDDSSDSDGGETEKQAEEGSSRQPTTRKTGNDNTPSISKPILEQPEEEHKTLEKYPVEERGCGNRRRISDSKLFRSIPKLQSKPGKGKRAANHNNAGGGNESASPSPARLSGSMTPRAAPVLSRMIEAQSRYDPTTPTPEEGAVTEEDNEKNTGQSASTSLLSIRLKEIFGFDRPEEVIGEYPCWLMQSALLQGYMYVTKGHICFYAYLPQKSNTAVKSGYLAKRGRKNPKYNRYWFSLKGVVFSYYADPSQLYFPSGHVDLRYGISASLSEDKVKDKDFTVMTDHRIYHFRADSAANAKEWVKALQKVIFHSHNEGSRLKISLPVEHIIDIEESPMIDFAETFKVRVVDSNETYAIDEYFFSFFNLGKDAFNILKQLINDTPSQRVSQDPLAAIGVKGNLESGHYRQSSSPGTFIESGAGRLHGLRGHSTDARTKSDESSRRRGEVMCRTSLGQSPQDRSLQEKHNDSSDSFVHSVGQGTESSIILQSTTDTVESASQILNRSDVFRSPTIHRLRSNPSASDDTARSASRKVNTMDIVPPGSSFDEFAGKPEQESQGTMSDSEQEEATGKPYATSTPGIQELVKAGTYPLQRAAGFAEYLKSRSRQMSSLLASESMGYIEKVSGMWAGGGRHYAEGGKERFNPDRSMDQEDVEDGDSYGDRFRAHFALPATEKLQATYYGHLHRVLPLYGKIYIGNTKFCFRSLLPGTRTKMILPIKDIENVEKEKGFRFGYQGLVLIIRGHEELFFEFNTSEYRDDCAITLHHILESMGFLPESTVLFQQDKDEADAAKAEHQLLQEARQHTSEEDSQEVHPIFDDPRASIINFKPTKSLRITCLTIGSRGDVQPYIALCKGLLAEGHRPKIATHAEFEPWVRKHGIDFAPVEGDPAELMRICVENGMFTYSFLKEASLKFRGWIDDLLSSAWVSCRDSDILIESPSAMAGIHIAEALRIPYFRAFTMPWSRTRAYPHAFAVPEQKMGGAYNYITYVMFDNVFWKAISGQVNRWRKRELGLRGTNMDRMQPNKVPFLYNFSPSVVAPPLDYPEWIRVTGYWFLNEGLDWTPSRELSDFIECARRDGKKIVYIGFGSIVVSDPAALTKTVVESVQRADVRCILSKGWSDRLGDPTSTRPEITLPLEIHQIQSAPHDWLFTQVDAVAHHGGAGTTGASLRAGVPTIIKPFFGDQFFFGSRVEDLGVGICMKKLNVSIFSRALWEATHSERMIVKAQRLGKQIRKETGVSNAIQIIYRDLEYATTLTCQRSALSSTPFTPSGNDDQMIVEDESEDIEETWTFVDDDIDLDIRKNERQNSCDLRRDKSNIDVSDKLPA